MSAESTPEPPDPRDSAYEFYDRLIQLGGRPRALINDDPGPWNPANCHARNEEEHVYAHWDNQFAQIADDYWRWTFLRDYQKQHRTNPAALLDHRKRLMQLCKGRGFNVDLNLKMRDQDAVADWEEYLAYELRKAEALETRLDRLVLKKEEIARPEVQAAYYRATANKDLQEIIALQMKMQVDKVGEGEMKDLNPESISQSFCADTPDLAFLSAYLAKHDLPNIVPESCGSIRWPLFCAFQQSQRESDKAFEDYKEAFVLDQRRYYHCRRCHNRKVTLHKNFKQQSLLAQWTEYLIFELNERKRLSYISGSFHTASSISFQTRDFNAKVKECKRWIQFIAGELQKVRELHEIRNFSKRKRHDSCGSGPARFSERLRAKAMKVSHDPQGKPSQGLSPHKTATKKRQPKQASDNLPTWKLPRFPDLVSFVTSANARPISGSTDTLMTESVGGTVESSASSMT